MIASTRIVLRHDCDAQISITSYWWRHNFRLLQWHHILLSLYLAKLEGREVREIDCMFVGFRCVDKPRPPVHSDDVIVYHVTWIVSLIGRQQHTILHVVPALCRPHQPRLPMAKVIVLWTRSRQFNPVPSVRCHNHVFMFVSLVSVVT